MSDRQKLHMTMRIDPLDKQLAENLARTRHIPIRTYLREALHDKIQEDSGKMKKETGRKWPSVVDTQSEGAGSRWAKRS